MDNEFYNGGLVGEFIFRHSRCPTSCKKILNPIRDDLMNAGMISTNYHFPEWRCGQKPFNDMQTYMQHCLSKVGSVVQRHPNFYHALDQEKLFPHCWVDLKGRTNQVAHVVGPMMCSCYIGHAMRLAKDILPRFNKMILNTGLIQHEDGAINYFLEYKELTCPLEKELWHVMNFFPNNMERNLHKLNLLFEHISVGDRLSNDIMVRGPKQRAFDKDFAAVMHFFKQRRNLWYEKQNEYSVPPGEQDNISPHFPIRKRRSSRNRDRESSSSEQRDSDTFRVTR